MCSSRLGVTRWYDRTPSCRRFIAIHDIVRSTNGTHGPQSLLLSVGLQWPHQL